MLGKLQWSHSFCCMENHTVEATVGEIVQVWGRNEINLSLTSSSPQLKHIIPIKYLRISIVLHATKTPLRNYNSNSFTNHFSRRHRPHLSYLCSCSLATYMFVHLYVFFSIPLIWLLNCTQHTEREAGREIEGCRWEHFTLCDKFTRRNLIDVQKLKHLEKSLVELSTACNYCTVVQYNWWRKWLGCNVHAIIYTT